MRVRLIASQFAIALLFTASDTTKLWAEAEDAAGNLLEVVTYRVGQVAPEGRPGSGYLRTIREAARQRGLPDDYIAFLDRAEARE